MACLVYLNVVGSSAVMFSVCESACGGVGGEECVGAIAIMSVCRMNQHQDNCVVLFNWRNTIIMSYVFPRYCAVR